MLCLPVLIQDFGPPVADALTRLLMQSVPVLGGMLADPRGVVSRIGDTLVWSGPAGQKVIGALEMLGESQTRIEGAVNGIQSAQLAMQSTLGLVQTVSMMTLGVTSLTGAYMAFRLHALNKRVDALGRAIKDVEGKIDAEHKAHLRSSLQFLREYDDSHGDGGKLRRALEEARHAANIYGELAIDEANNGARLPVLNYRGRCYILSLLTELRCLMSGDDSKQAIVRIDEERNALLAVAKACFNQALGKDPFRYLSYSFRHLGVNLNLLALIYRQAERLGVISPRHIENANDMFESVRHKLEAGHARGILRRRTDVEQEVQKLRYVLACLEETDRISGLRLMISDVQEKKSSLSELLSKLKEWRQSQMVQERAGQAPAVFAYAL